MAQRHMKYNPAFLKDDEIIDSFVVRLEEFNLIMGILKENTEKSNQHVLVIGPRGSGKTTLLLRIAAEIRKNPEFLNLWYPLVYAEESYDVASAGEFWLNALQRLEVQTNDDRWKRTYEDLSAEKDDERLHARALAQLMDFADSQNKRILLIVENLDMLLGRQCTDTDAWALRKTLLHEPRVMLLASAVTRFDEVENHDRAMFELFRQFELKPLDDEACRAVWRSVTGYEPKDKRIRPIQILTGGNPRLISIISLFGAKLSFKELMDDIISLVDDHTEYFKSHLDSLAPTERKVYLALAELWRESTSREISKIARLDVNKTSAMLNRLVERGDVSVKAEGKNKNLYHVAERMYNIYYLMRKRGESSSLVRAVVDFMKHYYEPEFKSPHMPDWFNVLIAEKINGGLEAAGKDSGDDKVGARLAALSEKYIVDPIVKTTFSGF